MNTIRHALADLAAAASGWGPVPRGVAVRAARPRADRRALLALEAACFGDAWDAATLGYYIRRGVRVLVAEAPGGAVAGSLLYHLAPDEVKVWRLAVAPAHRRRGVAGRLLAAVEARVDPGWGDRPGTRPAAGLKVRESNLAALRLYAGRGWRCTGIARGYYDDGEDALRMKFPG